MARTLLRDTCELAAAILAGEHDDNLAHIEQAAQARQKHKMFDSGIRKRSRVTVIADESAMKGRVGTVVSVNKKSVTVELDQLDENDWRTGWRFPPEWLEAVTTTPAVA